MVNLVHDNKSNNNGSISMASLANLLFNKHTTPTHHVLMYNYIDSIKHTTYK